MYKEVKQNLFTAPDDYALAHCVAKDFMMGAGIALEFKRKFGCVDLLLAQKKEVGQVAVLKGTFRTETRFVFYIVTKEKSFWKPTLSNFEKAIDCLSEECLLNKCFKLAIPKIGCGLDRLCWETVRNIVKEKLCKKGIEVVVYIY